MTIGDLHQACLEGNLEKAELLLKQGENIDSLDEGGFYSGTSPLHLAIRGGHADVLQLLLKHGANLEVRGKNGDTPLIQACRSGELEIVKVLVEHGANIDAKNTYGKTPIHCALREARNYDLVKYLLEKGVDTKKLKKPLEYTVEVGRLDVTELFILNQPMLATAEPRALLSASDSRHIKSSVVVKLLIQNGADVNYISTGMLGELKQTALHFAVLKKSVENVWQLVLHGADISVPYGSERDNRSVWQLCADHGNEAIKEALLHFWTPNTHKYHPQWTKEAIICVLLIARRQNWPFDKQLMNKILSYVAFGWYTSKLARKRKLDAE